ncbi:HAD-IA family hydrolase [Luteococcus peritonei]|uniref:HAD-IA family hydrolase n=1 Tax=Luteococcus peritonei TaxID=88874 RepID=A0ABW4RW73_9ACTN
MAIPALSGRLFQGVIFDLDQTLVDSRESLAITWGTWMREYQITPDPSRNWGGWTSEDIIRLCLPEERVAEGLARMEELETTTTTGIVPLPGAQHALAALPRERVAVGTSGSHHVARARLAAAGLEVPSVLVTASDVEHGKPAPDVFLQAAHGLGLDPADCLVVEDAPLGLDAARAAGMASLALLTSTPREQLQADAVVADLSEVHWEVTREGIRLS